MFPLLLGGLSQLVISSLAGDVTPAQTCASFELSGVDNAVVTGRTFYNTGANVTIANTYDAVSTTDLPAFCRIQLVVTTNSTANSSAQAEVWLPQQWNDRLLMVGNGGFGGGGQYDSLFNVIQC